MATKNAKNLCIPMWPGVLFFVGALAGFADQIGTWIGTLVSGQTVRVQQMHQKCATVVPKTKPNHRNDAGTVPFEARGVHKLKKQARTPP